MIDTNEIGAFVKSCQNADYLHHLIAHIKERLQKLDQLSKPVCRNCAGRKTVLAKLNGFSVQVQCPKCQVTEPKSPDDYCI